MTSESDSSVVFEREARKIIAGVKGFADEMKELDIHVGMGNPPRCVNCGQTWPCSGSGQ